TLGHSWPSRTSARLVPRSPMVIMSPASRAWRILRPAVEPRMSLLRSNLGCTGNEPGQLTLPELQVLIRRAGEQGGFDVLREVHVLTGRMDYVWVDPATRRRIVAWELDGRNVCPNHIAGSAYRLGNKYKFDACE